MNPKNAVILIAFVFAAVSAFTVIGSDVSSADTGFSVESATGFKENSDGTLALRVSAASGGEFTFSVIDQGDSQAYCISTQTLDEGVSTVKLDFRIDDPGTSTVMVSMYEGSGIDGKLVEELLINIDVGKSIWSGSLPYITLIAVAVIVAIVAFVYIRNRPKTKPSMTFTELEAQKEARKMGETKGAPASTDRRKYESVPRDGPSEASDKDARSGKDDGKKIRYVSSRRK